MRSARTLLVAATLLAVALAAAGCGGGTGTGGTTGSAEDMTFEAWDIYRRATDDLGYSRAATLFANALAIDPGYSEAHNGLGWVNLQRAGQLENAGQRNELLGQSLINFERATAADPDNADAWAGLAGLELARKNYTGAIAAANKALDLNPRYFSQHDNIDYRDLHLLLAESFIIEGSFADGPNSQDPNNAVYHLDKLQPGFSNVYGTGALTPQDLIRKIEELQAQ